MKATRVREFFGQLLGCIYLDYRSSDGVVLVKGVCNLCSIRIIDDYRIHAEFYSEFDESSKTFFEGSRRYTPPECVATIYTKILDVLLANGSLRIYLQHLIIFNTTRGCYPVTPQRETRLAVMRCVMEKTIDWLIYSLHFFPNPSTQREQLIYLIHEIYRDWTRTLPAQIIPGSAPLTLTSVLPVALDRETTAVARTSAPPRAQIHPEDLYPTVFP